MCSSDLSGFLGTARISLNDNLIQQGTSDEVLAVMGHEMGHYVMGHVTRGILMDALVILIGFVFLNWGFLWAVEFFGGQWQVRKVADVAGLPLLAALGTAGIPLARELFLISALLDSANKRFPSGLNGFDDSNVVARYRCVFGVGQKCGGPRKLR